MSTSESAHAAEIEGIVPAAIFRSRYQICDDCECVTLVQRNDDRGVPDEVDWDQFPGCMVCGGSMLHWDADERTQDDIYWAKGRLAERERVARHAQAWANQRFDAHGPQDARGAALWDLAAWLREADHG